MPWRPSVEGEVPTLGYGVLDWIGAMLAHPASVGDREPFTLYREQEDFVLRWYELDPVTGRRRFHRGLLGRPRGWGKSPLLGALACVEALGPVLFDGWDADGQPVGRPWSDVRVPIVQIAAVSEEQTRNTWAPLLHMLREGAAVDEHSGLDPMESFVALPGGGRIDAVTSSARTIKGAPTVFGVLDQTEEWVRSNGGRRLANTMRANAAKTGGTTLESPNAYVPGEGSVAEESAGYAAAIREGRARDEGLLWDHREAPGDTDMTDRESLVAGMRVSYGDSSGHPDGCVIHSPPCPPGHQDLDRLVSTIWDPAQDPQISRSDFLNQITHASDSWVASPEWAACLDVDRVLADRDAIVLGFDGSRGRNRGNADATALIGCRVSDGHLFEIGVWEPPTGGDPAAARDWQPNPLLVEAALRQCFERWRVVGFAADPTGWTSYVAQWEATYGRRLRVRAGTGPIAAFPRGKDSRVEEWVRALHLAVATGELSHDGSSALTRHVLNARRRPTRRGYLLYKAYPDSPDKIDAAYAAVLAWRMRTEALAAGVKTGTRASGGRSGRRVVVGV